MRERRLRAQIEPDQGGGHRDQHDGGHEHRRHLVRQPPDRRLGALGFFHQLDDPRQGGVRAHPGGPVDQRAALVQGTGGDAVAGALGHRHRLAGEHGFVQPAAAFFHFAVHGDFLARAHPHAVAGHHLFHRNVLFAAVTQHAGGFGAQVEQAFDGGAGLAPGAHFQGQAQADQADDHGAGFEIDMAGRFRHQPRRQHHHHGVQPGGAGAQRDQRVHVGVVVAQRLPGADEERPSGHRQHRQGDHAHRQPGGLAPGARLHRHAAAEQAPQHQRCAHAQAVAGVAQQLPVVGLLALLPFLVGAARVLDHAGAVAGAFHRADQIPRCRPAAYPGAVVGQVHARLADAGHAAQGGFDAANAGGAGGAGDRKLDVAAGPGTVAAFGFGLRLRLRLGRRFHAVTALRQGAGQCLGPGVAAHGDRLFIEIHLDLVGAGHRPEGGPDFIGAALAGGALNRQVMRAHGGGFRIDQREQRSVTSVKPWGNPKVKQGVAARLKNDKKA